MTGVSATAGGEGIERPPGPFQILGPGTCDGDAPQGIALVDRVDRVRVCRNSGPTFT